MTNSELIKIIENNIYRLNDFSSTEMHRSGFTSINDKITNTFIDGDGYLVAKFKIATRSVNKKLVNDLVKQRKIELEEKGIAFDKYVVVEAITNKLSERSDVKFVSFDLIFDTKNNQIYSSASVKLFENQFIPFLKSKVESKLSYRLFTPKFTEDLLTLLFTKPEIYLNETINVGSFVQIVKDDGSLLTFEDTDLKTDDGFQKIIEKEDFKVSQVKIMIKHSSSFSSFKINKKALPTNIFIFGVATDSDNNVDSTSETENMTKEQVIFDDLFTRSIISFAALKEISEFMFDFSAMAEESKKISEKNITKATESIE